VSQANRCRERTDLELILRPENAFGILDTLFNSFNQPATFCSGKFIPASSFCFVTVPIQKIATLGADWESWN